MRAIAVLLAVAASAAACEPGPPVVQGPEPGDPAVGAHGVLVAVENDRIVTMRIFATRAGMRFLVGQVGPRERGEFRLPPIILRGDGELRLEADPLGSTQFEESEPIVLEGGRSLEWSLRRAGHSRVRVR